MKNTNILLNQCVGSKIKVYLVGNVILKGTLNKYYVGEDSRGKFYEWAIVKNNGYRRFFASTDVLGFEPMK